MFSAEKDPDSILDYSILWSEYLVSDVIVTSTWLADAGITIDSITNSADIATVWVSGGIANRHYDLTNRITTQAGRTIDRTISVYVHDR